MNAVLQLPDISLTINGSGLNDLFCECLTGIRVHQRLNLPSQAVLQWEMDSLPAELPFDVGAVITLSLTPGKAWDRSERGMMRLFDGEASVIEQHGLPDRRVRLVIRAYDKLHALRRQAQLKVFSQVNLNDLAAELARPLTIEGAPASPTWAQLFQLGESHFDFLRAMAARCGACFFCDGDTLRLMDLSGVGSPMQLSYDGPLRSYTIRRNSMRSLNRVGIQAWDTHKGETIEAEAGAPRTGVSAGFGTDASLQLLNVMAAGHAEASALAQAALDQRAASDLTVSGIVEGHPGLTPGTKVCLGGIPDMDRTAVVGESIHRFDAQQGYVTEFDTRPPDFVPPIDGCAFTMGKVTRVNDPDGLARVRVNLVGFGECETEWLPVLLPAAGADKGLVALPDVDDNVLVLVDRSNPTQAIVLGAFYAPTSAPEGAGVVGANTRQFHFLSPGGHRISLDDAGGNLTLTHSGGSKLEFTPSGTTLSSLAKLVIEAKGSPIEIRGAKIDMNYG